MTDRFNRPPDPCDTRDPRSPNYRWRATPVDPFEAEDRAADYTPVLDLPARYGGHRLHPAVSERGRDGVPPGVVSRSPSLPGRGVQTLTDADVEASLGYAPPFERVERVEAPGD